MFTAACLALIGALPPPPPPPASSGPTVIRRDLEVPWRCAGATSIVQVEKVPGSIRRIAGVACVWTSCADILQVAPFAYVVGPEPLEPRMTIRRFVIDDPGWLSQLEGPGMATYYADRRDGAADITCSGARIHLWIELAQ